MFYKPFDNGQVSKAIQQGQYQYVTRQTTEAPLSAFEQITPKGVRHTILDMRELTEEYGPGLEIGQVLAALMFLLKHCSQALMKYFCFEPGILSCQVAYQHGLMQAMAYCYLTIFEADIR